MKERIQPVYERLHTVIIENLDWQECLDRYDRPNTFMYIDPPYPGNKCNYVHNMRDWNDHHVLAERLGKVKCKWIVSSYDMPEIHNLYGQYHIVPIQSFSGMNVGKNDNERKLNREVLILNFSPHSEANGLSEFEQTRMNLDEG